MRSAANMDSITLHMMWRKADHQSLRSVMEILLWIGVMLATFQDEGVAHSMRTYEKDMTGYDMIEWCLRIKALEP